VGEGGIAVVVGTGDVSVGVGEGGIVVAAGLGDNASITAVVGSWRDFPAVGDGLTSGEDAFSVWMMAGSLSTGLVVGAGVFGGAAESVGGATCSSTTVVAGETGSSVTTAIKMGLYKSEIGGLVCSGGSWGKGSCLTI
jgi:hypothetical protein